MNKNLFVNAKEPNSYRERVLKEDAQQILLLNATVIVGGTVRYFGIAELGLGVYEIGLLEKGAWRTEVMDYIPTLKEDGTKLFPHF